ncbi:MAG: hydrogen gas-evolving membrane-bound hydrogenase subunit E [Actinomycetota bacterium]
MIGFLLLLHLVLCAVLAAIGSRLGTRSLLVASLAPAASAVWAVSRLGADEPSAASWTWVAGLDLELAFRVGPLAALMTLLVSGIGALVFIYAYGYFSPGAAVGPFATSLLSFSTAMLGLVWADSVWALFIFWELTSITSFLLVGHRNTDPEVRAAARRALVITVGGGLALLAGLVLLVDAAGSARLSEMGPVTGAPAVAAGVLVVSAAATKSAQVPFHIWLPGAMAAPTPVSAYLHSATMVKAGVLLLAVTGPVLGGLQSWRVLGLVVGIASMLWGAIGALRHVDAKLILAWGTVSQLGLMVTLLAVGDAKATFAAVSILAAHAVFKAALFMVVGEIDVRVGTRIITELGGLSRAMPLAFVVAAVSAASMAGVPPLLGFAAKEAAIEAALGFEGGTFWLVGGAIIAGSVLTVAYTTRFLLGVFGPGPAVAVASPRPALVAPSVLLAASSLVGFVALDGVNRIVGPAAVALDPEASVYRLLRWPGLTTAFVVSVVVVGLGAVLGWGLTRRARPVPAALGARLVDVVVDGVVDGARRVTGRVQHGSLPVYVATMAATTLVVAAPFAWSFDADAIYAWDSPAQGALVVLVVAAAAVAAVLQTRLGAALGLGAVGMAVAGLFVVQGAPDLALTQLLVETVIVVGFVVGLGHLGRSFPPVGRQWRTVRIAVATAAAAAVAIALAGAASTPVGEAPVAALATEAQTVGGGNNVVNVILTDTRALDTLGEIVVIAVAAVGVLALAATSGRLRSAS